MEAWEWWPFIIRRSKTIIWTTALTAALAVGAAFVLPPMYRSMATINVQPVAENEVMNFPSASQMVARNAGELIKSPTITRSAAKALGKSELEGSIDYRVPEQTSLIEVIVDAPSPQIAADEANAIAEAFVRYNAESVRSNVASAQKSLQIQIEALRKQVTDKQAELAAARTANADPAAINGIQDELDTLQTGYEGLMQRWQGLPAAEVILGTAVNIADKALPDPQVVSPKPIIAGLLGIIAGLLLGVAIARATEPVASRQGD